MASWVEVARATMQYEWPDFELINSLGVFQTREGNHSSDERRLMLDRLVTPILLDGRQLTNDEKADYLIQVWRQYQMCRPFAVKIAGRFATSPQKDYLCWTESVRKAKKMAMTFLCLRVWYLLALLAWEPPLQTVNVILLPCENEQTQQWQKLSVFFKPSWGASTLTPMPWTKKTSFVRKHDKCGKKGLALPASVVRSESL